MCDVCNGWSEERLAEAVKLALGIREDAQVELHEDDAVIVGWLDPGHLYTVHVLPPRSEGLPQAGAGTAMVKGVFVGMKDAVAPVGDDATAPSGGIDCHLDAQTMAAVMLKQGIIPCAPDAHVLLDPTAGQLRTQLTRAAAEVRPEGTLVFYFSGHGQEWGPTTSLCLGQGTHLSGEELQRILYTSAPEAHKLVILDMCHAGGALTLPFRDATPAGVAILAACRAHETAQATAGLSLFTKQVVEGLEGGARVGPLDPTITPESLHHFVHARMAELGASAHLGPGGAGGADGPQAAAGGGVAGKPELQHRCVTWWSITGPGPRQAQPEPGSRSGGDGGSPTGTSSVAGAPLPPSNGTAPGSADPLPRLGVRGGTMTVPGVARGWSQWAGWSLAACADLALGKDCPSRQALFGGLRAALAQSTAAVVRLATKSAVRYGVRRAAAASAIGEVALLGALVAKDAHEYRCGRATRDAVVQRLRSNMTRGGASLGGAVLGQVLIPVPGLGAVLGSAVGTLLSGLVTEPST